MTAIQQIETLISQARYLEAQHRVEPLTKQGQDLRLDQLYALALSKSGVPEEAQRYLETVYERHREDPETAGIMGSIYKALFKKNQQSSFALLARDTYYKKLAATKSHYTGVNAASMSVIIMQGSKCKDIARQVISLISTDSDNFCDLATLGEVHLLVKEGEKAVEFYVKARKIAGMTGGRSTVFLISYGC